jgi:hypothetical protein
MSGQISAVHTPCKKCSFAKYEDKTQTGCFLNYIDIYKANNEEVLDVYDEENEFFVINNKKCIGYRENKWFDKKGLQNVNIENKIKEYQKNNFAHYVAVINLKSLNTITLNNICKILSVCNIKPQKIVLVRYKDDEKQFHYTDIEKTFKDNNINFPWRIQTMLEQDMSYTYILYDIVKNNKQSRFILNIESDSSIDNIINYANDKVYNKLKNFCCCGNQDKNIVLYSSTVFRHAFESGKDIVNSELYEVI